MLGTVVRYDGNFYFTIQSEYLGNPAGHARRNEIPALLLYAK